MLVDELEHGLGADFQQDPTSRPLAGVIDHHLEAEIVEISSEAPGDVRHRPGGHLGADPGALDQEGRQQLQAGGLLHVDEGFRYPVDPEHEVSECGGVEEEGDGGPVVLVVVGEAVLVVRLTLWLASLEQDVLKHSSHISL